MSGYRYFAIRQVNPYRGVVQVVRAGLDVARSYNGLLWYLRPLDETGQKRRLVIWSSVKGLVAGQAGHANALLHALAEAPSLPFPLIDTWECWLLDRDGGMPLALIATQRGVEEPEPLREPVWQPFVAGYRGFSSATLAARDAMTPQTPQAHGAFLMRLVNRVARPEARAQWFWREADGSGIGGPGWQLPRAWLGRVMPCEAFPELLLRANWESRLEGSVIRDYHAWLAPLLLPWTRLSPEMRSWLELEACERPAWLLRVHRLLGEQCHPERIRAALVAARLEQAQGSSPIDWIEV